MKFCLQSIQQHLYTTPCYSLSPFCHLPSFNKKMSSHYPPFFLFSFTSCITVFRIHREANPCDMRWKNKKQPPLLPPTVITSLYRFQHLHEHLSMYRINIMSEVRLQSREQHLFPPIPPHTSAILDPACEV